MYTFVHRGVRFSTVTTISQSHECAQDVKMFRAHLGLSLRTFCAGKPYDSRCRTCFLFRTISSADLKTEQFLRPLNIKVWYLILCTIIVGALVLAILLRQEGIHDVKEGYDISVLLTIGAMAQQCTC